MDTFALGQITVTAPRAGGTGIDRNMLLAETIYTFSRISLDNAVNLMPGVSAGMSGGTRNERLVFVRGFDRFQVPLSGKARVEGALFYSWIDNAIFGVLTPAYPCTASTTPPATPRLGCALTNLTQSRNVGKGDYYGGEISVSAKLAAGLDAGFNYTLTKRKLAYAANPAFRPTGVPTHKGFIYVDWSPVEALHVVPNLDIASNRWTLFTANPATAPQRYYRTGSYVNAGLRVDFDLNENIALGAGGRNLFDYLYSLTDGIPEPGRSFFASVRAKY